MKKIIFTYLIIFSATITINAQSSWSIKIGTNYSTFYDEQNSDWINGIYIGIGKYYNLYKDFGISAYIIYDQKGGVLKNKIISK